MAELHSNLYFKHPKKDTHNQLVELFSLFDLNSNKTKRGEPEDFKEACQNINPTKGFDIAQSFLEEFEGEFDSDFGSESIDSQAGYSASHWVNGSNGDYIQKQLIAFLYELCPEIHAQSWGCGDDDPWEFWFLWREDKVIRFDNCPFEDDDTRALGTIYRLWHEKMPKEIREGFLFDEDYQEDFEFDEAKKVTDEEYEEWLSVLGEDEDEDEELPYEEAEIEDIGPKLSDEELQEVRAICHDLSEDAGLNDYLITFSQISNQLVALEDEHQSGQEMDPGNPHEFIEFYQEFNADVEKAPIKGYLTSYLRKVLDDIAADSLLGTLILRHDEVLDFIWVLGPVIQEGEGILEAAVSNYEDFWFGRTFWCLWLRRLPRCLRCLVMCFCKRALGDWPGPAPR